MAVLIVPSVEYSMNFLNSGMAYTQTFSGVGIGTTTVGTLFVDFKVQDFSDKTIFCLDRLAEELPGYHRGWSIEIFDRKISGNWYNGSDQRASISRPIQLNTRYKVVYRRTSNGFIIYVNNTGNFSQRTGIGATDATIANRFVFAGRRPILPENRGNCEIFAAAYYPTSSTDLASKLLSGNFKDATYWWTGSQSNGNLPINSVIPKRIWYNNIKL